MGHNESSVMRKINSRKYLNKKWKILHKQLNCTPEGSRTKRSKLTQEKSTAGNRKLRAKITQVAIKYTIQSQENQELVPCEKQEREIFSQSN